MKTLHKKLSFALLKYIEKKYKTTLSPPLWDTPVKIEFGDLTTNSALRLSSLINKPPLNIAEEIKLFLEDKFSKEIDKIEVIKPGFVNIFISTPEALSYLEKIVKSGKKYFQGKDKKNILLEFVSANPTGPLSIAHGRGAVIGDALARLFKFFGNKVTKEYYINDAGRQIELLTLSVSERIKELQGKPFNIPEDGYQGEYIKEIAKEALKKKIAQNNLESFVLKTMLNKIKNDLRELGVNFDSWVSQKNLISPASRQRGRSWINKSIKLLKEKELLYEKDGALWFSSSRFSDNKDRVIKKKNGELTYFASDIAYHYFKLQRKFDKLINLWGPDHHGYIERLRSAIKALGEDTEILSVLIIQLVTIKGKEKMSRRRGSAIFLTDLINEIGKDIARFYYLCRKNSSHLEVDIQKAKEKSFNNPYYYIQYACARIESIFKKAKEKKISIPCVFSINQEEELRLLRTLLQFPIILEKVYLNYEPVFVIEYLKTTAAAFHKFYEKIRVISEDRKTTAARLALIKAVKTILTTGLDILGITPLKEM